MFENIYLAICQKRIFFFLPKDILLTNIVNFSSCAFDRKKLQYKNYQKLKPSFLTVSFQTTEMFRHFFQ